MVMRNLRRLVALSFAAGAVDAVSFYQLGRIFTANMTGNIVLLGLFASHGGGGETARSAVALGGYVCSALAGFRVIGEASGWDRRVAWVLWAEAVLLVGFVTGWAARVPIILLALVAALAMGLQSAAVNRVRYSGISTTYVTGMLTSILGQFADPARSDVTALRRLSAVLALALGAMAAGILQTVSGTLAALLPAVAVLAVLVDLERNTWKRWTTRVYGRLRKRPRGAR